MKHTLFVVSSSALILSILACSSSPDKAPQSPDQALKLMQGSWTGNITLNAAKTDISINAQIADTAMSMQSTEEGRMPNATVDIQITNEGGLKTANIISDKSSDKPVAQKCLYDLPGGDGKALWLCCGVSANDPRPADIWNCTADNQMMFNLSRVEQGEASVASAEALTPEDLPKSLNILQGAWAAILTNASSSDTLAISISGEEATSTFVEKPDLPAQVERLELSADASGFLGLDFISELGGRQRCVAAGDKNGITMCCAGDDSLPRPTTLECTQEGHFILTMVPQQ